jgi:glycine cleavage system H protein
MSTPDNLKYTAEHMWVNPQTDGSFLVGITDYAQDMLGDIVYVDAPSVGTVLEAGKPCGLVESVKTGSDLHAPLNGTVEAINEALQGNPELLNDKPYGSWIFRIAAAQVSGEDTLLDATSYKALIG